jgi:hypothetical protein
LKGGVSYGETTGVLYDSNAPGGRGGDAHFDEEPRFFIIGYSSNRPPVHRLRRTPRRHDAQHPGSAHRLRRRESYMKNRDDKNRTDARRGRDGDY